MNVYLVLGYGIPKDIYVDDNYRRYLGIVFNTIYAESVARMDGEALVIVSGGNSDCFKPYRRTEAQEMADLLRAFAMRTACRPVTKFWRFVREKRSLSTLENLIYARAVLATRRVTPASLTIFCEATRAPRIRTLARKLFPRVKVHIVPVEFDLSANRYLDPDFLRRKENAVARYDAWALQDPRHLAKYRRAFVDKIRFLREAGPAHHVDAVKEWWKKRLSELDG